MAEKVRDRKDQKVPPKGGVSGVAPSGKEQGKRPEASKKGNDGKKK